MVRCSICKKKIVYQEPLLLVIRDEKGESIEKKICATCENKLNALNKFDNPKEIKIAIKYLKSHSTINHDNDITSYLCSILEFSVSNLKIIEVNRESVDVVKYYFDNDSGMYSNIGEKIKTLAKIIALTISILTVIAGIAMINKGIMMNLETRLGNPGTDLILWGIGYTILGPLFSFLTSFFMYGFGELIVRTTELGKKQQRNSSL